jgi:hypothetical protein
MRVKKQPMNDIFLMDMGGGADAAARCNSRHLKSIWIALNQGICFHPPLFFAGVKNLCKCRISSLATRSKLGRRI